MHTPAPDPNLIAFVGDIHALPAAFACSTRLAAQAGAATIIQVGDLGVDTPDDLSHLQQILTKWAPTADYRVIDGNHENFNMLNPDAAGPVALTEQITYMPRGTRARLAGAEILFCGGATSIDRDWRTEGINWFPDESITPTQADRAVEAAHTGPVDLLVTHETTSAALTILARCSRHAREKATDPRGIADRVHIDRIATAAGPRAHIHGHHHTRFAAPVDGVLDISLDKEASRGSVVLLDTRDWSWHTLTFDDDYTFNDDGTELLDVVYGVAVGSLWQWGDVALARPEVSLAEHTGPLAAQTVESITAHEMTLQRVTGDRGTLGRHRPWADVDIDEIVTVDPDGRELTLAAENLKAWITDDDIDALAVHLLDPRDQFEVYRRLSPLVTSYGTEEIALWAEDAARKHGRMPS